MSEGLVKDVVKRCKTCGVEKPLGDFSTLGKNKAGEARYRASCKQCTNEKDRKQRNGGVDPGPLNPCFIDLAAGLKDCTDCGKRLPLSEFHKCANAPGGVTGRCKTCKSARRRLVEVVRVCRDCGIEKPLEAFPKKGAGRRHVCEGCCNPSTKVCKECGIEKPLKDLVTTNNRGVLYYREFCKSCRNKARRIKANGEDTGPRKKRFVDKQAEVQACIKCGQVKPFSEFSWKDQKVGKLDACCKECKSLEWRLQKNDGVDPGAKEMFLIDPPARRRQCTWCREVKSFDEFHMVHGEPTSRCKECINSLNRIKTHGGVDPGPPEKHLIDKINKRRECTQCRVVKPFSEFYTGTGGIIQTWCKECKTADIRKKNNNGVDPGPQKQYFVGEDSRECSTCGQIKPFEEFPFGKGVPLARCRVCKNKMDKANPQGRVRSSIRQHVLSHVKRHIRDSCKVDVFRDLYRVRGFGCSLPILAFFLENQFYPHPITKEMMTWENYGKSDEASEGWDVDHINPLSSFDLTDSDQFVEAAHVSNLQPLWHLDNLAKHAKIMTQEESRSAHSRDGETQC